MWDQDSDPGAWGDQWTDTTGLDNLRASGETGTEQISSNVDHTDSKNTTTYTNWVKPAGN